LIELVEKFSEKITHRYASAIPSFFGLRMWRTTDQLNHVPAARLPRGHGPADQVQLLGLVGSEIRTATRAFEQAQQEVASAADFPRGAIGEIKDHWVRN